MLANMFFLSDNFLRRHVTGSQTYVSSVLSSQVSQLFPQRDSAFSLISRAAFFQARACRREENDGTETNCPTTDGSFGEDTANGN